LNYPRLAAAVAKFSEPPHKLTFRMNQTLKHQSKPN